MIKLEITIKEDSKFKNKGINASHCLAEIEEFQIIPSNNEKEVVEIIKKKLQTNNINQYYLEGNEISKDDFIKKIFSL